MAESQTQLILVRTTSNDLDVLKRIGRQMLLEQLAACVQIGGPLESQFSWDGKLDTVQEWSCSLKTTRDAWPRVLQTIQEMHNYDTPEIIAVPIIDGCESYLKWVRDAVSP